MFMLTIRDVEFLVLNIRTKCLPEDHSLRAYFNLDHHNPVPYGLLLLIDCQGLATMWASSVSSFNANANLINFLRIFY